MCRDGNNPRYFVRYHFKIVICRNFDIQNRNAEIGLENPYDSAKIRMVGISAICSLFFKVEGIITVGLDRIT